MGSSQSTQKPNKQQTDMQRAYQKAKQQARAGEKAKGARATVQRVRATVVPELLRPGVRLSLRTAEIAKGIRAGVPGGAKATGKAATGKAATGGQPKEAEEKIGELKAGDPNKVRRHPKGLYNMPCTSAYYPYDSELFKHSDPS